MTTRFTVGVQPRDGSKHYHLSADLDAVVSPASTEGNSYGDTIMIWDGLTVEIHSVSYAPTMDPSVYVRGRTIFPYTAAEAKEIVDKAVREEGWKVVG